MIGAPTATGSATLGASVTDWPERLLLTGLVLLVLLAVLALMRWGWVRRGRRQDDVEALPSVPPLPSDGLVVSGTPARYLGTTRAGDWLDRLVVHGLGTPSTAQVSVGPQGIWCLRTGAPDLFIARSQVLSARHDRGLAGKVYEEDGVVVIRWAHGSTDVDTGLRIRDAAQAEMLRSAASDLARAGEHA